MAQTTIWQVCVGRRFWMGNIVGDAQATQRFIDAIRTEWRTNHAGEVAKPRVETEFDPLYGGTWVVRVTV